MSSFSELSLETSREIVNNYLNIFGFDKDTVSKKYSCHIKEDTLDNPGNSLAPFIILRFIAKLTNKSEFKKLSKYCWPITSKKMEEELKKVCLTLFNSNLQDLNLTNIHFLKLYGRKFYCLLIQLFNLISKKNIANLDISYFDHNYKLLNDDQLINLIISNKSETNIDLKYHQLINEKYIDKSNEIDSTIHELNAVKEKVIKSVEDDSSKEVPLDINIQDVDINIKNFLSNISSLYCVIEKPVLGNFDNLDPNDINKRLSIWHSMVSSNKEISDYTYTDCISELEMYKENAVKFLEKMEICKNKIAQYRENCDSLWMRYISSVNK